MAMTKTRKSLMGVVFALAILSGVGGNNVAGAVQPEGAGVAGLASLPGRHLQPPWWEAVKTTSPNTYVVPGDVLFAFNSTVIDVHGQSVLVRLVPQMRGARSITVAGCTDGVGGAASPYNFSLGLKRADAAVSVLERAGLPSSLFHAVSWADIHPVEGARGLDVQTLNAMERRIVIMVTK